MLKAKVIKYLINNKHINGSQVAQQLGVSRSAIWKVIAELRKEGFKISSRTNSGYFLESHPDLLSAALVEAYLQTPWNLLVFDSLDSTNNEAKRRADLGLNDRSCLICDEQTGGKGRRGRSFVSKKGLGLYMSLFLRPTALASELSFVTSLAAVAVNRALTKVTGVSGMIKWPNDIVINGKKLCGILTELSVEGESGDVQYLVVGIGINVSYKASDFPREISEMCTSLAVEDATVARAQLAAQILDEFSAFYQGGRFTTNFDELRAEYARACITLGSDVMVNGPTGSHSGRAIGLDDEFGLIVELETGGQITVRSGEVSIRGLYGYVGGIH